MSNGCQDVILPLSIPVLYARDVVGQRWNDVLAVKNERYNGGYTFTAFQWYKNGAALAGETHSYLYQPLDMNATYYVDLTRTDGTTIPTCPIQPIYHEDISDFPTLVDAGKQAPIRLAYSATLWLYTVTGQLCEMITLPPGENIITIPPQTGIYTMKVQYLNGEIDIVKMLAR